MHLRVVVTLAAQTLDQHTARTVVLVAPLRYAEYHLVAVVDARAVLAREVYVHRQLARVGVYEYGLTAHLRNTHITLSAALDNLRNSTLGMAPVAALTLQRHLHAVTVQRMARIVVADIYVVLQLLDLDIGRTRRKHVDHALVTGQLRGRKLILVAAAALYDAVTLQCLDDITYGIAALARGVARSRRDLLEGKTAFGILPKHIGYESRPVLCRNTTARLLTITAARFSSS